MPSNPEEETKAAIPEGGPAQDKCPYCKGTFPRNLPLVNGETQLERHIKVFHAEYSRRT